MLLSAKEVPENILKWMTPADQRTYGPGIHPADDPHPPLKTDKLEREEQRQFASYCLLHDLPFSWHATNARSKATPGTPDFWTGVNRFSLWIEFKRDYSCKLSPEQEEFKAKLEAQGMRLYIVYSALEAIELVNYFDRVL
jgi:hypothetical protein